MVYKIAFYGDDFTGSTDALETLEEMGLHTMLFTEMPSAEQLAAYPDIQAFGVAGMTRTMASDELQQELEQVFVQMAQIKIRHVHYKVCSTFDSSAHVGSIGRAIDVGAAAFASRLVPLVVGAPYLGRYCVFGNLFARMGTGLIGEVFRLDRHPSMAKHPVTPAQESDLRLHLAKQTKKVSRLIDVTQLEQTTEEIAEQLHPEDNDVQIALFDVMTEQHLVKIGAVLDRITQHQQLLFSVGSSAVSKALCAAWKEAGELRPKLNWPSISAAKSLLVLSGSGSVVTGKQIDYAIRQGFVAVALDGEKLLSDQASAHLQQIIEEVLLAMRQGKSVVVHTSIGPDDPRISKTRQVLGRQGLDGLAVNRYTASLYGKALAAVADQVAQVISLERIVIAGGDTSSLFARHLGIEAVEMIAPIVPGAPLCRIHAQKDYLDGVSINFKGGQVGDLNYFTIL